MAAFLFIVKKRCFNNATRSRILIAYHEREEKVHQIGKKFVVSMTTRIFMMNIIKFMNPSVTLSLRNM